MRSEADLRGALDGEVPTESEEVFPESQPIDEPTEEPADGATEETAPDDTAAPTETEVEVDVTAAEPVDYQLTRALDLLRGLALLSAQAAE